MDSGGRTLLEPVWLQAWGRFRVLRIKNKPLGEPYGLINDIHLLNYSLMEIILIKAAAAMSPS